PRRAASRRDDVVLRRRDRRHGANRGRGRRDALWARGRDRGGSVLGIRRVQPRARRAHSGHVVVRRRAHRRGMVRHGGVARGRVRPRRRRIQAARAAYGAFARQRRGRMGARGALCFDRLERRFSRRRHGKHDHSRGELVSKPTSPHDARLDENRRYGCVERRARGRGGTRRRHLSRTVCVLTRANSSRLRYLCKCYRYRGARRGPFFLGRRTPRAAGVTGTILAKRYGQTTFNQTRSPQSVRLLLLEDNVDAAASLAEALIQLDRSYDICRVTQLKEAEEVVQKEPLEIALIDLTLPDADGCEAAIALRRVAPDLPLVALTGKNFEHVALELVRIGVQDFLQKGATSVQRIHQVLQLARERHRQESALRRAASFDALTGVLNRSELLRQLAKAISHASRSVYRGAVLIIDIDDFKQINDTFGHLTGDAVLKDVAAR